jgi:hypothetical protein
VTHLAIDERVDWFRVIADLRRTDRTVASIAEELQMPRKTIEGWAAGCHPRHADGERLIDIWCRELDRPREALPILNESELVTSPREFLHGIESDAQVRLFEQEPDRRTPSTLVRDAMSDSAAGAAVGRRYVYERRNGTPNLWAFISANRAQTVAWWKAFCSEIDRAM